jgi:hypothetical protein
MKKKEECSAARVAPIMEGKRLVLLQVNCRSIYNKTLDFWNLIDTYNPDVVIGTESWLSEEINNGKCLGMTTQLSEDTDTLAVVECLFV